MTETTITLSPAEHATVLAALRFWQRTAIPWDLVTIDDIGPEANHFLDEAPLQSDEIDALCDRLNMTECDDLFTVTASCGCVLSSEHDDLPPCEQCDACEAHCQCTCDQCGNLLQAAPECTPCAECVS